MTESANSGLPLRDAGVGCEHCGSERRRPESNRCAGCGRYAPDPRYGRSPITGTWYRVHEWKDRGDGRIRAQSKEQVSREDVPDHWIRAVEEASDD